MIRAAAWLVAGTLVVLATRALVYALSPSPLAPVLEHQAGGPRLPIVAAVSLSLALAVSAAAVGLTALGVRERRLLAPEPVVVAPRLRPVRFLARTLILFAATSLACALLESYLHWRAGLGWHGLRCLVGPVHRNAVPILGALSLVASAIFAAVEHVVAWMRRTIARLRLARPALLARIELRVAAAAATPRPRLLGASLGARGPPLAA